MAELATEPAWLEERRAQGASLTETLPLPDHKTKGWDFTDLSKLDLDAYTATDAAVELSGGAGATLLEPGGLGGQLSQWNPPSAARSAG